MWLRANRIYLRQLLLLMCLLTVLGCDRAKTESRDGAPVSSPASPPPSSEEPVDAEESVLLPVVIFLGDSLTAGYGLSEEQAFPALVAEDLAEAGLPIRAVNAGISGDTTAGGLSRLDWLLRQKPDLLMVALGANDGLRGVDPEASEENLRQILTKAKQASVPTLLAGMLIPPNYGEDYAQRFAQMYPRLAEELDVPLIPFLLERVAAQPELNLPDGIHPNAEGQGLVAQTVLEHLEPVLREAIR